MIKAEFFIQLVGSAFFLILNIFLVKSGFSDSEIANFISYRFLAVMVLAFPFGIYIKGRPLKPFFIVGSVGVPVTAVLIVLLVKENYSFLLPTLFVFWGIFFTMFQVSTLPYIMRNTREKNQSHAISLNYAVHSFSSILSAILIFSIARTIPFAQEGEILLLISFVGILSLYFLSKIKVDTVHIKSTKFKWKFYDWSLIFKAVVPTFIIAVGAGLTIPFINLFFYHSFKIDSSIFAIIGGMSSLLVAIFSLMVPSLKNKLGFKNGIIYSQMLAVAALVLLASTEFFVEYWWAFPIALICYWLRAPLMNMAAPLTSEMTMKYVGNKNQEMLSAIMAAIWSGSWFFSSQIFRFLKERGVEFAYIFYITAALYAFGILMYYFLIIDYEKKNI